MDFLAKFTPFLSAPSWLIAFSGGVDSHVLLDAIIRLRETVTIPPLRVIHVNHALQQNADEMASHCRQVCSNLFVEFIQVKLALNLCPGESLEAVARRARYDVILAELQKEDVVFTGHHLDDQAETLLLQLLRGAGMAGLASMAPVKDVGLGKLARPLLDFSRKELLEYAKENKLSWIDDPSNQDVSLSRNYLRHQVMPNLIKKFPSAHATLARSAAHCAETHILLSEYVQYDLKCVMNKSDDSLDLGLFSDLSHVRQKHVLRAYLSHLNLPIPSTIKLKHILSDVVCAREDASPCVEWEGAQVRRYQGKLYAFSPLEKHDVTKVYVWDGSGPLTLPGVGVLSREAIEVDIPADATITVRFRQGGEVLRLPNRGSRSLKKLLQERSIKPWLRDRIPLLYVNDDLVSIMPTQSNATAS